MISKGGATFGSTGDDVGIGSGKNLGLAAAGTLSTQSTGQTSIKSSGIVAVDGSQIHHNSGLSNNAVDEVAPQKPQPTAEEA
jgi:hypothetical protein